MRHAAGRLAAVVLLVALPRLADAATRMITGTLAPGGPTMPVVMISTPDCIGQGETPVLYRAYPFTVDVGGTYTFAEPGTVTAVYVHAGAFDAANSFATCIRASNSNPIALGVNLTPGTNYTVVITDDRFGEPGLNYALTISGPGNIIARCAGFVDMDLNDAFCPNVEWLRNREITLGCTMTAYCPNDPVTRLQMAAFLNRLGNALEPLFAHRAETAVHAVSNANGIVCQTEAVPTGGFPRVASLSASMFYHAAVIPASVSTKVIFSIDAGATWTDLSGTPSLATNPAGAQASQSPGVHPRFFPPGTSVIFGIRAASSPAVLNDAGCELAIRLDSHTGASGAFDQRNPGPSADRPSQSP